MMYTIIISNPQVVIHRKIVKTFNVSNVCHGDKLDLPNITLLQKYRKKNFFLGYN